MEVLDRSLCKQQGNNALDALADESHTRTRRSPNTGTPLIGGVAGLLEHVTFGDAPTDISVGTRP